ncbi:MFS transporter [Aquimarina brevivitae]|uniref:MFS transporter n=1 Tax=Aquimarina brevivitae TaxID=323412 RepID=UPI00102950BC|nr:MFS transporter [Aquimarina brevivitae]
MKSKFYILPIIIISQFLCTSLWFAGNVVIDELASQIKSSFDLLGYLISFVQFGFIVGTLTFALLTITDRFSPSKIFMICALLASISNLTILIPNNNVINLLTARFATGFFLAGIYPVGMKIASDYFQHGLGRALGFLVGALVLGTAFPHFINAITWTNDYTTVIISTSVIASFGGILLLVLVPDGPYRKPVRRLQLGVISELFSITNFRKAAIGYFGHMWELYAFWGFVPILLKTYTNINRVVLPVSFWSFIIIGIGAVSCAIGGIISIKAGSRKVAFISLSLSGLFCLLSPLLFLVPPIPFLILLCIWGMVVIADSPQFSSIVATAAPAEYRGTGLTIVNCIGFAITIFSIQLLDFTMGIIPSQFSYMLLAIGPIIGLYIFRK